MSILERRIFVAGHRGLVGSAILRELSRRHCQLVPPRTRKELDLMDAAKTRQFFLAERPDIVILAAGRVGGIRANSFAPGDFIRENLLIQTSVIEAARQADTRTLIFFGSTCLYPKLCRQPMREECIGTGPMEETSEAYSVAKLAGMAMCEAYRRQYGLRYMTVIPATLYGRGDHFDSAGAHVLGALLRRFHEAKAAKASQVVVWGTGTPVREFLYSEDFADAILLLLDQEEKIAPQPVNVGTGDGVTIRSLAEEVRRVVGFEGEVAFDPKQADGAPCKILDSSRMRALGWTPRTSLRNGLQMTYEWFLGNAC